MKITIDNAASKALRKLPRNVAASIMAAIEKLSEGNIKRLQGRSDFRLRVGDWRVIFDMTAREIRVKAIGSRQGIYKG